MSRDRVFPLLLLCFLLSGLSALVYETAWTREFAFVFGTSELAVATVLAAYMGGLAVGAAVAGRITRRIARPVLVYGWLELSIAVVALGVPAAIAASRTVYVGLFAGPQELADASGGSATAIFYAACSFGILLLPTAMMGATLPVLARQVVGQESEITRRVGTLYGVNTVGAVLGTLLASFVLLPAVGLRATIWVAAGVNTAIFAMAWAIGRSMPPLAVGAVHDEPARAPSGGFSILPMILVSGAISFGYEILWVRLVTHLVGASVQAFATMLASFLAGIAFGSALAARWASTRSRAAFGFAVAQVGIAALSLAAFFVVDLLPGLGLQLEGAGWPRPLVDTLACVATLLPGALCIGATLPLAIRIHARSVEDSSRATARVYSWNTVGSIVGSIGAAFFLLPLFGFAGGVAILVGGNLALAFLAAVLFEPRRLPVAGIACAGGVLLLVASPRTPWTVLRTIPGQGQPPGVPVYLAIGRSATVLLSERTLAWDLRTNGLPEASIPKPGTWPNRLTLARWLTALPSLVRPETRSMLVVGLGGGVALEAVPSPIERVDVIELEPEVVEANRLIAGERWRDPLADPRVRVHVNDARNALLLAQTRFDAIVSQPSHPFAGGAAHLYTQEFFELVRSRLAPEGVFLQWVGLRYVDEPLFRSLLAALDAAFPHVRAYVPPPGGGVLFVASMAPLDTREALRRGLAAAPEDFARIGLREPEQVTARLVLDELGVRALVAGAPPNRDGHNRLQSGSENLGERSLVGRLDDWLAEHDPLSADTLGDQDAFAVLQALPPQRMKRFAETFPDPVDRRVARALAEIAGGAVERPRSALEGVLEERPQDREARAALLSLSVGRIARGTDPEALVPPPLGDAERAVSRGWQLRSEESADAWPSLDVELSAVAPRDPLAVEATRLRIAWRLRMGTAARVREAVELAEASLGDDPDVPTLLLRAEVRAAASDWIAVLESLDLLVEKLDASRVVTAAYRRRANALLELAPEDSRLVDLRARIGRALRAVPTRR